MNIRSLGRGVCVCVPVHINVFSIVYSHCIHELKALVVIITRPEQYLNI